MRRRGLLAAVVAAATAVVVAVTASPAAAAIAPFKPTVSLGARDCLAVRTQTSATGVTRGILSCQNAAGDIVMHFVRGNGSSWTHVPTGLTGVALAFADDGTSYVALYQAWSSTAGGHGAVYLLRRNRSTGKQTRTVVFPASSLVTGDQLGDSALVVSGGRYWAAMSIYHTKLGYSVVHTRQTLLPSLPTTLPVVRFAVSPVLARRGTTGMVMVHQEGDGAGGPIIRSSTRADGTWARSVVGPHSGVHPQVLWSKGVTRVAWQEPQAPTQGNEGTRIVLADDASGTWKRRYVPGLNGGYQTGLAMFSTGGKLTFVRSGYRSGQSPNSDYLVISQLSGSIWSHATISDGGSGGLLLMGAGGWSGKIIVVFSNRTLRGNPIRSRRQA